MGRAFRRPFLFYLDVEQDKIPVPSTECRHDVDKLVVANWWRGLLTKEIDRDKRSLKRVYRTFTSSNEKLINDRLGRIAGIRSVRPAAAAIIDDTSNVYVRTADTLELRNTGADCTAGAAFHRRKEAKGFQIHRQAHPTCSTR
jgi:hypothetical protein